MRTTLVLAAVLAAFLAGCAVALPEAATPEKQGHPWTDTGADLWVARQAKCGECAHGAESPVNSLSLLYRDGSVLHVEYGEGGPAQVEGYPQAEGDREGLTFADPAFEPYRDELEAAWKSVTGEAPDRVRVHTLQALRLDPTEREDVLRVVEHAVGQSADLPGSFQAGCPADAECLDGLGVAFFTFGAPQAATGEHPSQPGQADAAWRLLDRQFAELEEWLARGPAPAPGTP